jgi:large subunit ribosomal protein L1
MKKEQKTKIKQEKIFKFEDALNFVKENAKSKFDSTIEVHMNLKLDSKKQDQNIRFTTTLPHGTGKTKKVAVLASKKIPNADIELTESDIERLEKGTLRPKVDFDVLVTEPRFMSKLAKAAKVLGPAGVMPNPKNGTITEDIEKAVEQIKKGKIEVRLEPNGMTIHTILGKKSFDNKKLTENFAELLRALKQNKPQKTESDWIKAVYLSATMSPSAKINTAELN